MQKIYQQFSLVEKSSYSFYNNNTAQIQLCKPWFASRDTTFFNLFTQKIRAAFQTRSRLFLIMNYCPGGDLAHSLYKEKRFSEERARIYAAEIILAIENLHQRDIIFRDLKPDNVVIDSEGHALLTDFGLSKEGMGDEVLTKSFCGSIAYLAPEIIQRSGHGKSIDWYLLGVLLYEMLIGQPPYYSNKQEELFSNIAHGSLKLPSSLSPEAKSLIVGLLNRNPHKRLGSGKGDAVEIKAHAFFKSISWSDVLARKSPVPKPGIPLILPDAFINQIVDSPAIPGTNKLDNWTFVSNHTQPCALPMWFVEFYCGLMEFFQYFIRNNLIFQL